MRILTTIPLQSVCVNVGEMDAVKLLDQVRDHAKGKLASITIL